MQVQLCEEVRLKEEYAQHLSDMHIMLLEEKAIFEAKLQDREDSLELSERKFLDIEVLLQQEWDRTLQLQQAAQDGSARILTLESQVIIEKKRCKELQHEVISKSEEVS